VSDMIAYRLEYIVLGYGVQAGCSADGCEMSLLIETDASRDSKIYRVADLSYSSKRFVATTSECADQPSRLSEQQQSHLQYNDSNKARERGCRSNFEARTPQRATCSKFDM
jgi:hypothetical protein